MSSLSATVITFNEEKNIERCLKSLSFVDEIIVVDSGSTDRTIKIAQKYNAKIYTRHFDNFANQRSFANSKASGEWIISMDADEEIPSTLANEILQTIKDSTYDGYLIPRKNIIFGKEIKYTRWSPDKHIWLFRKDKGKWRGKVHEEIEIDGLVGELKNGKIHHSHETVSEFINMINSYTDLEAKKIIDSHIKFSFFKMFYYPLRSFFGRYFIKLGFLDGWRGFVLSYLMAIYRFVTWIKVWEKTR